MKRPQNRKSFVYRIYVDLILASKSGLRRKLALKLVDEKYGAPKWVSRNVWQRYVRHNMIEVQGRAKELF